ncbi:MAG: 4-hydroxy-tetrahydrodipicolinate synthase [Oscillospiraceae bacterium]|nr:4-hydroxy-tetrahydrodipicolinate synthase [Oscillospiraceae bacterium]
MSLFTGSGVALITPFKKDGEVDYQGLGKLIDFQIENGTDALIICGTTGEGSTVTFDEKSRIFSFAVERACGKIPVIAGTGSNSTDHTVKQIKAAEKAGVDAHLVVTPYYNKTSQSGVVRHYYTVADAAEKPVIVYNVPSRTGLDIKAETYIELSKHENIIGVKEASGDLTKMMRIIKTCADSLDVYVGNDDQTASATAMGAKGVISVLANIFPGETHLMAILGVEGRYAECHEMQAKYLDLIAALFSDVNPIPVKYAAEYMGLCGGTLRLPLVEMSESGKSRIRAEIKKVQI